MAGHVYSLRSFAVLSGAVVLGSAALIVPVLAASHDQIVQACREELRPQIRACAQAKGLMGNHEAVRRQCGRPLVHPCVLKRLGR
jgi:hypothetical protein